MRWLSFGSARDNELFAVDSEITTDLRAPQYQSAGSTLRARTNPTDAGRREMVIPSDVADNRVFFKPNSLVERRYTS